MRRIVKQLIGESSYVGDFVARSFIRSYKSKLKGELKQLKNLKSPCLLIDAVLKLAPSLAVHECIARIALECAKLAVARVGNSDNRALLASKIETAEGWLKAGNSGGKTYVPFVHATDTPYVDGAWHNACTTVLRIIGHGYKPDFVQFAKSAVTYTYEACSSSPDVRRTVLRVATEYIPYFDELCDD